jgi:hypothetical protein
MELSKTDAGLSRPGKLDGGGFQLLYLACGFHRSFDVTNVHG